MQASQRLFFQMVCGGLAAFALTGCATTARDEQVRALTETFAEAFKTANAAGQPLIDDLAAAERDAGQRAAVLRAKGKTVPDGATVGCPATEIAWQESGRNTGFIRGFCVADAPYFATVSEPPAAKTMRDGLDVVQRYSGVLLLLTSGGNIASAEAQLTQLSGNVSALLAFVPATQPYLVATGAALAELKPLLDNAAQRNNNDEVRRLLISGAPQVKKLLGALRSGAAEMFNSLAETSARAALSPAALDSAELTRANIARIESYRIGVANFVVLLDELQNALADAVAAAEAPAGQLSVASLTDTSVRLRIEADAVRRAWSALRSGPGVTEQR